MPWIYRRLEEEGVPASRMAERARHAADEGVEERLGTVTWDPELPPAPPDLHENATFALGLEEAELLRRCSFPSS